MVSEQMGNHHPRADACGPEHLIPERAATESAEPFRVVAIISAFNEGDIISAVLEHLIENGIGVYLIDNRSTDDTVDQARQWLGRGLIAIETFPPDTSGD